MNKQEVKELLLSKKGYQKKGINWLANHLHTPHHVIVEALREVRKGEINQVESKNKVERVEVEVKSKNNVESDIQKTELYKKFLEFSDALKSYSEKPIEYKPRTIKKESNTLVIADLHEPFCLDNYLDFCKEQQEIFKCKNVIFIGDLVDNHATSQWNHDPDGMSAGDEFQVALKRMNRWYKEFPIAKVCIGNHDSRPFRKAFVSGVPSSWLKSYSELLQVPKEWQFGMVHMKDNVIYTHGTGLSGELAAMNAARENRQSTVIGHLHTVANIRYLASYKDLIFGMTVGCGIDEKQYAFAYGQNNARKPVISCGVVLNNGTLPVVIPMEL